MTAIEAAPASERRPAAGEPPGPRGLPVLGVGLRVARDPYRSLETIARTYGDVAKVPLPGGDIVLVSHPDHVNHVMNRHASRYGKPRMLRDIFFRDEPRFHALNDGPRWKEVRRELNPRFTGRGLAPLAEQIIDAITEDVDGWDAFATRDEPVDMQHEFAVLTMSVLLRTMFSQPADRATVDRMTREFSSVQRGAAVWMFTSSLPRRLPRPYGRRSEASKVWILDHIDAMVAERRSGGAPDADDLLTTVLDARLEDGSPLSDEHVRRELMGLIIGGYETTAAVMSWVLARLPREPEALVRAYEEVDALGGRTLTPADLDALPWLKACFDEAQRLQGFPLNPREALVDDEIGGFRVERGATVAVSGWTLHRDPRFWREPLRFDPSRFLEDEIDKYAFLPFGVGPRRCLGARMGYMVGLATLAGALQRYRFELPPGWTPEPAFNFSSLVKGGVPATIERRTGSDGAS